MTSAQRPWPRRAAACAGGAGALLVLAWLSNAAPGGAGQSGPPAAQPAASSPGPAAMPGPANVRMNAPQSPMPAGRLGRAAGAIAADRSGRLLVAAWETLQGTCGPPFGAACPPPRTPGITTLGVSTDGGRTWTEIGAPYLGGSAMTAGHPWLDRGGVDGQTFFLTSRAMDVKPAPQEKTPGGAGQLGLLFFRGRFVDGTLKWTDEHLFTPQRPQDLLRAPSLLAAKDGSGRVFVAISTLRGICGYKGNSGGEISVVRSADEGRTWEPPVLVGPDDFLVTPDPKDPSCGSRGTIQISTQMAMGPGGELYLTWQGGPKLLRYKPQFEMTHTTGVRFVRSLDGGRSFSAPRNVVVVNSLRQDPPIGYSKIDLNDYPRLAVAAAGPHRGRLYVTYTSAVTEAPGIEGEQVVVSSQVYLVHSDDRGTTWSASLPLGPPVPPAGVKRFWPAVAVRQDGRVDVVYLEEQEGQLKAGDGGAECDILTVYGLHRKGKAGSLTDLYWVRSSDGGASFGAPVRLTSESSNWCKVAFNSQTTQFANFGDYLGIFTAGDRTFVVWTDGRNGVPDAYFTALPGGAGRPAGKSGSGAGGGGPGPRRHPVR